MAYIDPEGMFGGDRMALLSDSAKMAWSWFWCAGNTVGRVELNYRDFVKTVFRQFKKAPSEDQFWNWVAEFHESYLMFVYEVNGQVWGQWHVTEKYLPTYKAVNDKKTPAPMAAPFLEWQSKYTNLKRSLISGKCRVLNISENFQNFSETSKTSEKFHMGVERKGEELKPLSAGADGAPAAPLEIPSPEERTPPMTEDDLVLITAQRICARHPAKRKCGPAEAVKRLKAIIAKLPKGERADKLGEIDRNHEGWCESEQWTKAGGEYAKGLANWLAPTEGRYEERPPARASPAPQRKLNLYVKPEPPEEENEQPAN